MNQLLSSANVVVSFLCFLMSLHLFGQRSSFHLSVRFLAICFFTMGLHALLLNLNISNQLQNISAALQPAMAVLFGSLSYLIFRSALFEDFRLKFFYLLHLMPATAVFTLMISQPTRVFTDFVVLPSLLLYALLLTQIAWKKRQYLQTHTETIIRQVEDVRGWVYTWLLVFTVYSWLILASDILIFFELVQGQALHQSFVLVLTVLFKLLIITLVVFYALKRSPKFNWLYSVFTPHREKVLEDEKKLEFEKIIKSFEELVEDSTHYTQDVLSLKAMADKLCIPVRTFSSAVNHCYKESYAKRMNRLRIRFAQRLLIEQPGLSITQVMYESGFQTKSSFNKEFKAINEVSPSEFRQLRSTLS